MKRDLKAIQRNMLCVADMKEMEEKIGWLLEKIGDENADEQMMTDTVTEVEKSMLVWMESVGELQRLMLKFMIRTK